MREYIIAAQDEGQTVIKYLEKVLPGAKGAVVFKALRKKNIVLNNGKTTGKEVLNKGDSLKVFFSDEVMEKFGPRSSSSPEKQVKKEELKGFKKNIVFEDDNVLIINKDPDLLSQSDASGEKSLNDLLLSYLAPSTKNYAVKPSVCNRLDRNTSGLVLCGKTQKGLKELSAVLKDRSLSKYYYAICLGEIKEKLLLKGFLTRDKENNKSVITAEKTGNDPDPVETEVKPVGRLKVKGHILTLAEVHLITGKTHQIRAHMLSAGFPLIGDIKYCTPESLRISEELSVKRQMLHAFRVVFPKKKMDLSYLSGRTFEAPVKDDMNALLKYRM